MSKSLTDTALEQTFFNARTFNKFPLKSLQMKSLFSYTS